MDSKNILLAKLENVFNDDLSHRVKKRKIVNSIFQQYRKLIVDDTTFSDEFFSLIFSVLDTKELPESIVRYASDQGFPVSKNASFRELVTTDTIRRRLSGFQPNWLLNDKQRGLLFADMLGIPRPKIIAKSFAIKDINLVYPCVVKPMSASASKGVYIAINDTNFKCVKTGELLPSLATLIERMNRDISEGIVEQDNWQLEELVADTLDGNVTPATDLKFYSFYGEVGMVLEVERTKGARYRTWFPNGEQADSGSFVSQDDFKRTYFDQKDIDLVNKFSAEIPCPFISIDFLKADNMMRFGEFTPRPGLFDKYNTSFDNYLGQCYLQAEARLQKDLLKGKKFTAFSEFIKLNGGY